MYFVVVVEDKIRFPAASTGQRVADMAASYISSEHGVKGDGKVYKFKNIHGDRGTFDGLSSEAAN